MSDIIELTQRNNREHEERMRVLSEMYDKVLGYKEAIEQAIEDEQEYIAMEAHDTDGSPVFALYPTKMCVILSDDQNLMFDGLEEFNYMELLRLRQLITDIADGE